MDALERFGEIDEKARSEPFAITLEVRNLGDLGFRLRLDVKREERHFDVPKRSR